MTKLFFVISALLLATASARVIRDAPAAGNEIDTAFKNVQEFFEESKKNVFHIMGVKNEEEATKLVQTEAQNFFDKLATIGKDLKKTSEDAADKFENDETVKSFKAKITQAVEDFKKSNPDVAEGAATLSGKLTKTLETITTEFKNFSEHPHTNELGQKAKDAAKQVFDSATTALKELNEKLTAVAKQ